MASTETIFEDFTELPWTEKIRLLKGSPENMPRAHASAPLLTRHQSLHEMAREYIQVQASDYSEEEKEGALALLRDFFGSERAAMSNIQWQKEISNADTRGEEAEHVIVRVANHLYAEALEHVLTNTPQPARL